MFWPACEIFVLMAYIQKSSLNVNADVSSGARTWVRMRLHLLIHMGLVATGNRQKPTGTKAH